MALNFLIIGNKQCGKTTFINRHSTGNFTKYYFPTTECEITPISFNTNFGLFNLNIFDGGYPSKVDGVIVMFDLTNYQTFRDVDAFINWSKVMFGNIPIVLCGNKIDSKNQVVKPNKISNFIINKNVTYYDISAKSNYNYEKPFLYLLRQVTQKSNLVFTEHPALIPPEVNISNEDLASYALMIYA